MYKRFQQTNLEEYGNPLLIYWKKEESSSRLFDARAEKQGRVGSTTRKIDERAKTSNR